MKDRYNQADAQDIDMKKVEANRLVGQDIPYYWFYKGKVKMPDEFGRGK